jgi:hypothetical protein
MMTTRPPAVMLVLLLFSIPPALFPLGATHGSFVPHSAPIGSAGLLESQGGRARGIAGASPLPLASSSGPIYDEQLGTTFTQNFTSMTYNVTAIGQADTTSQIGPGYLLNGLSDMGYWYQAGLGWNWNPGSTPGTGFDLLYEVFDPNGNSIFPTSGGGGLLAFGGSVNQGDLVTLRLNMSLGQVYMTAADQNTGAKASETYPAEGAAQFVGLAGRTGDSNGFFTGLMTEWYHTAAYYGNEAAVTYSSTTALSSAWMWIDEFECPDSTCGTTKLLFSDATSGPVAYSNPSQLQLFSSNGATEYSDATTFITGSKSLASLTLSYAVQGGGHFSPPVLHYYQNGGLQSTLLNGHSTSYLVDEGTQWSVSGTLTGSGSNERWQTDMPTNGTGSAQTISFVYYHQDLVGFAFNVEGGGSAYSSPAITYIGFGTPETATPGVSVWADVGSTVTFAQTLPGSTGGERWVASAPAATFSGPGSISMTYYHQFLASLGYSVVGGGSPPAPTLTGIELGTSTSRTLAAPTTGYWIDSGRAWSVTPVLNGSRGERWLTNGSLSGTADAPFAEAYSYHHQYYLAVSGSPLQGTTQLTSSGWHNSGERVSLAATPSAGWQFVEWSGSGPGGFRGNSSTTVFAIAGPANETAQFYPGLTVTVTGNGAVEYSFGANRGSVSSGSRTVYPPFGTTVTLTESPSSILYAFNGWGGLITGSSSQGQAVLSAPEAVMATFGYNAPVIGALAGVFVLTAAGIAFALRRAARRANVSQIPT